MTGFSRDFRLLRETTSTNDEIARLAAEGAPAGTVVIAESQSAGRGRQGRHWISAPGEGLWCSVLLRPVWPLALWPRLSTWAAVGVAAGLESVAELAVEIKWPNDLQIDGKKVGGILTESHAGGNAFAVLGLGINLGQRIFPEAIRDSATSLFLATGRVPDRDGIALAILRALEVRYANIADEFPALLAEAEARNALRGRWIEAESGSEKITGIAETLDENGGLILRKADGSTETLFSGEVHLTRH